MTGPAFPRSIDDLVARMKGNSEGFNFGNEVLSDYLPFASAGWYLKPEVTATEWHVPIGNFAGFGRPTDAVRPVALTDSGHMLAAATEYAAFGWTKIENHRGISASRTIQKMGEWLWLLGWEPNEVFNDDADWGQYGAGCLAKVCEKLALPIPESTEIRRMIEGEPCEPGCDQGCSR